MNGPRRFSKLPPKFENLLAPFAGIINQRCMRLGIKEYRYQTSVMIKEYRYQTLVRIQEYIY